MMGAEGAWGIGLGSEADWAGGVKRGLGLGAWDCGWGTGGGRGGEAGFTGVRVGDGGTIALAIGGVGLEAGGLTAGRGGVGGGLGCTLAMGAGGDLGGGG